MKKTLLTCLAIVAVLAIASSASAITCTVDQRPAATLLVPYFQVSYGPGGELNNTGAGARDTIVTIVSRASGPVGFRSPPGLKLTWKYGTSSVAAGRWSTVHVTAPAGLAIARTAAIARHAKRVFFIEISSLRLILRKHTIEFSFPRTIPSPPALRFIYTRKT